MDNDVADVAGFQRAMQFNAKRIFNYTLPIQPSAGVAMPDNPSSENPWYPLPDGIAHENGHGDVAMPTRPATAGDPTKNRSHEQQQGEE